MPTGEAGRRPDAAGYAMAALLVAIGVLSIAATVALPVWRHALQREREAELIFRGEQYVRALALFERRAGPGARPPDVEFLVENRFLRKAWTDPVTGGEFQVIRQAEVAGPARAGAPAGIIGVVSTSGARSIRLYKNQDAYNEWLFVHDGGDRSGPAGSAGAGRPPAPGPAAGERPESETRQ